MLLDYSLLVCMLLKMSLAVNCLLSGGTLVSFFVWFCSFLINVVVKISNLCLLTSFLMESSDSVATVNEKEYLNIYCNVQTNN